MDQKDTLWGKFKHATNEKNRETSRFLWTTSRRARRNLNVERRELKIDRSNERRFVERLKITKNGVNVLNDTCVSMNTVTDASPERFEKGFQKNFQFSNGLAFQKSILRMFEDGRDDNEALVMRSDCPQFESVSMVLQ